jgi:hypothetical protein
MKTKNIEMIDKNHVIEKFRKLEAHLLEGNQSIGGRCEAAFEIAKRLMLSNDAMTPVLRTALVINWRESAMKVRYERFRKLYPEVRSLRRLQELISMHSAEEFCVNCLDIHPNPESPEKNPKYALLKALTNGFLRYQHEIGATSEIDALRDWANSVDIKQLGDDPIGRLRGVGPGVVENIRLNLGLPTVKPDRHVIGVAKQCLGIDIRPSEYGDLCDHLGLDRRHFDCVLFEYGKAMNISA